MSKAAPQLLLIIIPESSSSQSVPNSVRDSGNCEVYKESELLQLDSLPGDFTSIIAHDGISGKARESLVKLVKHRNVSVQYAENMSVIVHMAKPVESNQETIPAPAPPLDPELQKTIRPKQEKRNYQYLIVGWDEINDPPIAALLKKHDMFLRWGLVKWNRTALPEGVKKVFLCTFLPEPAITHIKELAGKAGLPVILVANFAQLEQEIRKLFPEDNVRPSKSPTGGIMARLSEFVASNANFKSESTKTEVARLFEEATKAGFDTTLRSVEQCFYKARKQTRPKKAKVRNNTPARKRLTKLTEAVRRRRGRDAKSKKRTNGAIDIDRFREALEFVMETGPKIIAAHEEMKTKLEAAKTALE